MPNFLILTSPPPHCALSVVLELMVGHRWNEELIARLFSDSDKNSILNIPLSFSSHQDAWYWKFDSKDRYSIKST